MTILIDNRSGLPIYEQIVTQIREQILSGELGPDAALPSIRALAKDLRQTADLRVTLKDAETGNLLLSYAVGEVPEGKKAMQLARIAKTEDGWYLLPEERAFDKWLIPDVFAQYGLEHWRE